MLTKMSHVLASRQISVHCIGLLAYILIGVALSNISKHAKLQIWRRSNVLGLTARGV